MQLDPIEASQTWPNYGNNELKKKQKNNASLRQKTDENLSPDPDQTQIYEPDIDQGTVISTMQSPHVYAHPQQQIMTAVYPGMVLAQPNMYVNEIGQEVNMHAYMEYQQSYMQSPEIHEPMVRDRRRSHRGRGNKRDTNRYVDSGPDMVPAYHAAQGQYHSRIPRNPYSGTIYYPTPDHHQNTQRQRPYFGAGNATMYSQQISHPVYSQVCQPNQYRHPSVQTQKQRADKHVVKREPAPRPQAINYGAPPISIQKKSDNISPKTNIDCVTTVIVNNSKIEAGNEGERSQASPQFFNNNNKNSDSKSSLSNVNNDNKVPPPVNLTIEHNIVATVNNQVSEIDKNDVPYVNINSSIQVKQKNEANGIELRKEVVSLVQASIPEPEQEPEPEIIVKEEPKEEIIEVVVPPEPEIQELEPVAPQPQPPASSMSWANILKKTSTDGLPNGKPTARINPLRIDVAETEISKFNSTPNEAPGTRQLQTKPRAFASSDNTGGEQTTNRNEPQEEYNSSNKFDDLDAYKTGGETRYWLSGFEYPLLNQFSFAEFLLQYQMEKQTVSLLPRGLINRNNYCYINSILQALLACPPFYNLLVALPHSRTTSRNSTSNNLTANM